MRHAVELRNPACVTPDFMALLRRHRIAWVIADTAGRWPYAEDVTSDFVYVRLHGDEVLYASGYSPRAIAWWAARIRHWSRGDEPVDAHRVGPRARRRTARGRDVYVYFDNDAKVRAPFDALALQRALADRADRINRTPPTPRLPRRPPRAWR
jgi:uncharacterized protein YecE (DUF72 family)